MTFLFLASNPPLTFLTICNAKKISERALCIKNIVHPIASTRHTKQLDLITRRKGNFPPSIWDDDYIQSLTSVYSNEQYTRRAEKLKESVRLMLNEDLERLDQLMLIDDLQRLGLSYHFEDVIERMLRNIYTNRTRDHDNLFATALELRLLRQHGFHVPLEVYGKLGRDGMGNFNICHSTDTKGLLSLYEASYLSLPGESLLQDARVFSARHLVKNMNLNQNLESYLSMEVTHALELPLHWRTPRYQSRWYIEVYEKRTDKNLILLELSKLDFNIVQATHQNDLKLVSRWWKKTALGEKLPFARDRLMENFLWTTEIKFEPQQGYCRRMLTKIASLITIIDDVYDVYGTLDELVLFTNIVERWDINLMEQLPEYMKICFLSLFNSVNEMAYDALQEQGFDIISYLKKGWADLCKSYLVEAKWYYSGYIPTFGEYLDNAWVSISAPVILLHVYFFMTKPFTKEAMQCLEGYPNIIRWSSLIFRLTNDVGTSSAELKRGDVPKSMECYMHDTGASEEEAREYIRNLIDETWKKMNEYRLSESPFSPTFVESVMNLCRMAQLTFQHGDGYGDPSHRHTKDSVLKVVIESVQL